MSDVEQMTSHRPYMLRALYEWIVDNGLTPHVLVDATQPGVRVPRQSVKDGRIVLNIAERAVGGLRMDNESLRFSARFGGVSQSVLVPVQAVVAIYARENGQGMALPDDAPHEAQGAEEDAGGAGPDPRAAADATDADLQSPDPDDGPAGPPPRRGGHLRIVK